MIYQLFIYKAVRKKKGSDTGDNVSINMGVQLLPKCS